MFFFNRFFRIIFFFREVGGGLGHLLNFQGGIFKKEYSFFIKTNLKWLASLVFLFFAVRRGPGNKSIFQISLFFFDFNFCDLSLIPFFLIFIRIIFSSAVVFLFSSLFGWLWEAAPSIRQMMTTCWILIKKRKLMGFVDIPPIVSFSASAFCCFLSFFCLYPLCWI